MPLTLIITLLFGFTSLASFEMSPTAEKSLPFTNMRASDERTERIYGSRYAFQDEFPFMVLLELEEENSSDHRRCSGFIISNIRVLTACHCLLGASKSILIHMDIIFMSYSEIFSRDSRTSSVHAVHPKCVYAVDTYIYDIGMVQIPWNKPFEFAEMLQPMILPWDKPEKYEANHKLLVEMAAECLIPSWMPPPLSHTSNETIANTYIKDELKKVQPYTNTIRVAKKQVISNKWCETILDIYYKRKMKIYPKDGNEQNRLTSNGIRCSEELSSKQFISRGHTGGPVICQKRVIGVVSKVYELDTNGNRHFVTYTSLEHSLDWFHVDSQSGATSPSILNGTMRSRPKTLAECRPRPDKNNNPSAAKITDGRRALPNEFPYIVFLILKRENPVRSDMGNCVGSIMTLFRVLTACHCLYSMTGWDRFTIQIVAGTIDYTDYRQSTQLKSSSSYILHPGCRKKQVFWFYDLAFVLLPRTNPLVFASNVQPFKWTDPLRYITLYNELVGRKAECQVAGWGAYGNESSILSVVTKRIIGDHECECLLELAVPGYPEGNSNANRVTWNGMFCTEDAEAGFEGKGDSGAPLVCLKDIVTGVLSSGEEISILPPVYLVFYAKVAFALDDILWNGQELHIPHDELRVDAQEGVDGITHKYSTKAKPSTGQGEHDGHSGKSHSQRSRVLAGILVTASTIHGTRT